MVATLEVSRIDLRYAELRLKDAHQERRLLSSIVERGVDEPLHGVPNPAAPGGGILLDGFKRLRCARRLGLAIVPWSELGADEVSGIVGLVILKSADSAFSGYPQDEYTTLQPTRDRIFATTMTAAWTFAGAAPQRVAFAACRERIRRAVIETFAKHKSESVQHTLYAMGESALRSCRAIDSIRLSMPNKHCLLVNLQPVGMENHNEIFVPTDEPHGLIEATIHRR